MVFLSFVGLYTVNDLINAHFQINASYVIHAPSTLLKLY